MKTVYVTKFEQTGVYTSVDQLAAMLQFRYADRRIDVEVYGILQSFDIEGMDPKHLAALLRKHVNDYLEIDLGSGDYLSINKVTVNQH